MNILAPIYPSNKFYCTKSDSYYLKETLISETHIPFNLNEPFNNISFMMNFAFVHQVNKHNGRCGYFIYVDLSPFYDSTNAFFKNNILENTTVNYMKELRFGGQRISFHFFNCSPSLWDNGYGSCLFITSKIIDFPSLKDELKQQVKTGISWKLKIRNECDDLSDRIRKHITPLIDVLSGFGFKIPDREVGFTRDWDF